MDWTKQTEELIKTWSEAQQKMWDSWMGAIQRTGSAQPSGTWDQAVEAWRSATQRALEAQVTWTRTWANNMANTPNTPTEMTVWSNQVLDVMQRWTETQRTLWERWFETLKQADPSVTASNWSDEAQKVGRAWQEAAQKSLEAQQEWVRSTTAQTQNQGQ